MRMQKKTESIVTKEPQTVANDVDTAEVAEIVRNGEAINWLYWASRHDISPNHAARLAHCIDPIRWPEEKHAQGEWSDDLREKVLRLTGWLAERRTSWTLAQLVGSLGEQFAPYTMKQSIWMQLAVADQQAEEKKQKAGRYTLEEAAQLLGEEADEHSDSFLKKLVAAVERGDLPVFEPGRNARYLYGPGHASCVRTFYEEAFWNDLNIWLKAHEPRIFTSWQFPKPTMGNADKANRTGHQNASADWREMARVIADELFSKDTANRCRDSLAGYSRRVMEEMQAREIHGPRGRIDNPNTIQREALQANKWWAGKTK